VRLREAVIGLAVLVAFTSSPAAAESDAQIRQGWLVGLSAGGGSAQTTSNAGNSDREAGIAGSVRVGYAFTPTLSLDLSSNAWGKDKSGTTVTFSFAGPMLSFYPGATGLVLRGGVGVGTTTNSTTFGNTTISSHESGVGVSVGAGYEFRVTRRFALGPQVDFTWTDQDGYNTNHVNGSLGASWYFLPRSAEGGQ